MRCALLLLLLSSFNGFSQTPTLSNDAKIIIITCGPGQDELYTAFGHSAIRVVDPIMGFDFVYNYGEFDFNQPNFYINYAKGFLYFKLARNDYKRFRDYYIYFDRYIHEQTLNLNQKQKQKLFDFLEWNNKPENRNYFYDYFYDNCATRIRDAMIKVFADSVEFDGSYITEEKTIRDLTDDYLKYQPWGDLGIDICLGLPMDKQATPFMHMYLPDYIESGFNHASITTNGVKLSLVEKTHIVHQPKSVAYTRGWLTPQLIFGLLFILVLSITIREFKVGKRVVITDFIIFLITGLLGVFLLLLWLATDHNAAAYNLNILWAFPLNFLAAFLLLGKGSKFLNKYMTFMLYYSVILSLLWFFLPQDLHNSLLFINLCVVIRSFNYVKIK